MEIIKSDFIEELNKYCKSKKKLETLNKNDEEINKENIYQIKENKIQDKENEFNKLKMDFSKSLAMSLKNNKNFHSNFSKENDN